MSTALDPLSLHTQKGKALPKARTAAEHLRVLPKVDRAAAMVYGAESLFMKMSGRP